jgi:hypothetical protein
MNRRSVGAIIASVLTLVLLTVSPFVSAATPSSVSSGNGLRISPVRSDLTINAGSAQTITVYVQNVTSGTAKVQAIINDFTASTDESGAPSIILNPNQYAPTHSLKRFVQPISDLTLLPGQQVAVPVTITIPVSAGGGGYYGVVRFAPASSASSGNVSLAASVGSLILVRVPGEAVEKVSIASFDITKNDSSPRKFFTSSKGIDATVRFQNSGNLQEEPFGKVLVSKGNKELSDVEVNNTDPRGNVLPASIRKFQVPLTGLGSFGTYTVAGNFGYGTSGQLLSASTTFYIIPVPIIILGVVILLLLLFIIFGLPKLVKRYNARVVQRATRRR